MANHYRGVSRALKFAGWCLHHQGKGSHEIWSHSADPDGRKITVVKNLKKTRTAETVMKLAGLDKNAYKLSKRNLKEESESSDNQSDNA